MAKRSSLSIRSGEEPCDGIEAKLRLDKLIKKSRDQFYKPIAIAEILVRNRMGTISIDNIDNYRRPSDRWSKEISTALWGYATASNGRYWDQLFDVGLMSQPVIKELARLNENGARHGLVEEYIYAHLHGKLTGIKRLISLLDPSSSNQFDLSRFVSEFANDKRYRKSVDKVYEVAVYALFNEITLRLNAKITLTIDPTSTILETFDDFAYMVLGVCKSIPSLTQPARLFRVGKANASDGGLDMWANFGPAVQVKHMSLSPEMCDSICERIYADKIIIVCKTAAAPVIESIMAQVGFKDRIRGIIPERQLSMWFKQACTMASDPTLGPDLLTTFRAEMESEFSSVHNSALGNLEQLCEQRSYCLTEFPEGWEQLWCL